MQGLAGGASKAQTRRAAAQSIVMWTAFIALFIVLDILTSSMLLWALHALLHLALTVLSLAAWIWTTVQAFQGKDVRVPIICGLASNELQAAAQHRLAPSL